MTIPLRNSTWADSPATTTPISAARLEVIESRLELALFPACARVFHNTTQSITSATDTTLTFNSELFDTDTIHDTATNPSRLTCKTAGKYVITGHVEWASNGTGARRLWVRLNGTTLLAFGTSCAATVDSSGFTSVTTFYDLAVNDYVELRVFQNSGGALNVQSTANSSPHFAMVRVA